MESLDDFACFPNKHLRLHSKICFQVVSHVRAVLYFQPHFVQNGITRPAALRRFLSHLVKRTDRVTHTLHLLHGRDDKKLAAYRAACTLKTCPIKDSFYAYRPSLAANTIFLALFSFSLCSFILQAALSRRFIGFSIAMVSGRALEVLGYVGRIMSWNNPFSQVCLPSLV